MFLGFYRVILGLSLISIELMFILFYVLSAVNSAIVLIDMFQKWLQLPTGGKVAELQGL